MTTTTSIAALLASYNSAAAKLGRPAVKRFADRKTAERRHAAIVAEVLDALPHHPASSYVRGTCPSCGATEDITCGQVIDRKSGQEVKMRMRELSKKRSKISGSRWNSVRHNQAPR